MPMTLNRLAAALALAAATALPAMAQTVLAPTAYDMPNGYGQAHDGSNNYWDKAYTGNGNTSLDGDPLSGGLGDLTDGVIATGNWNEVENLEGTGPYVGWSLIDPVITFHFAQAHTFSHVKIWHDDANGYGNVATPMGFTVTVGAQSTYFAITDPGTAEPFASTLVLGPGFTGSSLQLQVHRFDSATMLSEVQISAVPEPASAALLAAGAGLLLALRRRSRA